MLKRFLLGATLVCFLALAGFFYILYEIPPTSILPVTVQINKGDNVLDVAKKLEGASVIPWKWPFVVSMWIKGLNHSIIAGEYNLNNGQSQSEIIDIITKGIVAKREIKVVFPEGWTLKKMAERLDANNLPGDEFLDLAMRPKQEWREQFPFLKDLPQQSSLEGFLFPDTYTFFYNASAEDIIVSMLKNFEKRWDDNISSNGGDILAQRSIFDIVTFASIIENEVVSSADRKLVADIFWKRLAIGQPLQSDATIKYILGKNKIQHSIEETRVDSPYNTYVNKGLPPGPISNPGIDAILATIDPTPNPYYYFLSDPETKETVFSITFEEHVTNKQKHGL